MSLQPVNPIPQERLAERRARFQLQLGESVAIVAGGKLSLRSGDVHYPFRQRSDLLYLTGFEHPEAVGLFTRDKFILFVQPHDPAAETWTGTRPGIEGAVDVYAADEALPIEDLSAQLSGLLENRPRLYHQFGLDRDIDEIVLRALENVRARGRSGITAPDEIVSPYGILHEMRLFKDEDELTIMRAAATISCEAHHAAARLCSEGRHEYELEAALEHIFRKHGGSGPAYPPIVAAGENATILHYVENRSQLQAGEMVLIDAGVELQGYACDVTRTYPVGGRFDGLKRDVYSLVLRAQEAALRVIQPGTTLPAIHDVALRVLAEGLIELGAIQGDPKALIEEKAHEPFYMHSTGHFLGMDVHDVGDYSLAGQPRKLEPGMVFTVEPGLYFSARTGAAPTPLQGIGVRIEDNVVITDDGFELLTEAIPKQVDDVEAWMQK